MEAETVSKYLALSYGYTGQVQSASNSEKTPEDEEFVAADRAMQDKCFSCVQSSDHVKAIAEGQDLVIFERKVGEWTHRFRSRFISTGEGQPARVEQVTEIVPPGPFLQRELSFPLNKDLGEAGCLFQSALVVCNLFAHPEGRLRGYTSGARVVEVGSGTGVVGIAAALLGARVVVTDLPHVLPQLERNVEVNLAAGTAARRRIACAPLAWGSREHAAALGTFDLVVCSDCLYREETHGALLESLQALCCADTVVVMALEIRRPPIEANFFARAAAVFAAEPVEVPFKEDNDVCLWFMRLL